MLQFLEGFCFFMWWESFRGLMWVPFAVLDWSMSGNQIDPHGAYSSSSGCDIFCEIKLILTVLIQVLQDVIFLWKMYHSYIGLKNHWRTWVRYRRCTFFFWLHVLLSLMKLWFEELVWLSQEKFDQSNLFTFSPKVKLQAWKHASNLCRNLSERFSRLCDYFWAQNFNILLGWQPSVCLKVLFDILYWQL